MSLQIPPVPRAPGASFAPHGALLPGDPMAHGFGAGTLILTLDGALPVEELQIGDRVITRDGGAQPLLWLRRSLVTADEMSLSPKIRPVRLTAGALARDVPNGDTLLSPRHRLLIRGAVAQTLFGTTEVVANILDLLNGTTITRAQDVPAITYVQMCFAAPQIVYADGLEALTAPETASPRSRRILTAKEAAALA